MLREKPLITGTRDATTLASSLDIPNPLADVLIADLEPYSPFVQQFTTSPPSSTK